MSNNFKAYLFALGAVACWSTVATAFKLSLRYLDIYQLLFYATLSSTLILLIPILIRGEFKKLLLAVRQDKRTSFSIAALNPIAYYLVLFAAYDRLPAQIAQPINYTWSIVFTFMTIVFLRQKPTRADIIAALICYLGVVIVASRGSINLGNNLDMAGVLLAILSTLIWSYYWILNIKDLRDSGIGMCLNFMMALPITALLCGLFSSFSAPIEGIGGAIYVGIFEMGLAFLFWSRALNISDNPGRVSTLIYASPFLSLFFIRQILDEPIYTSTYIGLTVIILGFFAQTLGNRLTAK